MSIGIRLLNLRKEFDKTQKEIATQLGIAKNTLCQYEKDTAKPSIEILIKLAILYNVSTDYILGLENEIGAKTKEAEKQELEYKLFVFKKK
ncbi:MAG: helix-turn-helix transcriptional regulator [Clostridia bacterium]